MNRTDLTNRLKIVIKKVVPDADAILYGSEARGEAKKNSDIDVLILVDKDYLSPQELLHDVDVLIETH